MNTIEFVEMVVKTINERYRKCYEADGDKIVPPFNFIVQCEIKDIANMCEEYGVIFCITTDTITRKMYIKVQ